MKNIFKFLFALLLVQNSYAQDAELAATTKAVDSAENQYSGRLILNKKVRYYYDKSKDEIGSGTLSIIDAKVQFFNNKASSIYLKAKLIDSNKVEKLIFLNNKSSVPLRFFNNYGNMISTESQNRKEIWIDYNDVFDYEADQFFNYSVANDLVSISTLNRDSASARVVQRRFFDFFTAVAYSDVLGYNSENSNSLLNAQATLLLPLNLRNYGIWTPMRQLTTSINVALGSSFEDETRFISIADAETFNHFDLLKKNNLYGKLSLQAITLEYKRLFLNISLGYSAAFYRTGFRYIETTGATDIESSRQLLSLGYGPFLNFEIRPQTNFGADINVSLENLDYQDIDEINGRSFAGDIITDSQNSNFGLPYNVINVEANFYWLTSPQKSKGGVFAKIGSYYHSESDTIFPQILVGYATNLTSFVNRFSPKKK